ncbi:MAG TPA: hypothetical protein DCR15_04405 [Arthrobacter bacterium]|jgi:hypothetical protein|nr:hypothetical protein [Arthrobacter sp.]HAP89044.1 hypothetical protein [Arthrobacter sp.]
MSISPGFTSAEIRAYVFEYHQQPYGAKMAWLRQQPISSSTMRRWIKAVFDGELDRGLIPREGSGMTSTPRQKREAVARSLTAQQEAHDAEVAALNDRIRSLEASNSALGKAIGLLHVLNVEEPGETPTENKPPRS